MHSDSARSAADTPPREVVRLRRSARVVLVPVAVIGAVLSFAGIYEAAAPSYGPVLSAGFPFLVDFLILGASLQYIAGAKVGRPRAGWRLTAHAGVAGTLVLNAMAAQDLAHLPWHVVAPAVWSVLVEMTAREVLGEWKATHRAPADRIPARLWLTAPVESARTWLLMARLGATDHRGARVDVGVMAAATEALRLALPGYRPRRVRRIIRRQLRAGSLPPVEVLTSLGWVGGSGDLVSDPAAVLRASLQGVLAGAGAPAGAATPVVAGAPAGAGMPPAAGAPEAAATSPAARPEHPPVTAHVETVGMPATPPAETPAPPAGSPGDLPVTPGTALDAPRRPFNDPIFLAPEPLPGVVSPAEGGDAGPSLESTGDRPSDAVALLRADPSLDAAELAVRLRALGWVLSERTANRVLAEARHYLRAGRLTAVP